MIQVIHIFKKDVRHLWPPILAVIGLTAVYTYTGSLSVPVVMQDSSTLDLYNSLLQLAMPLGWWYLIAATIHQEVLPGHQQFWLTRPYSWKSLLAAKGLFILAFVNLPKLLADCVILQVQGFRAASYWPNLIGSQILFAVVWLLPFAALASVTRNLRQFILAVLMIWVVILAPPVLFSADYHLFLFFAGYWFGATWIRNFVIIAILLIASLLILLWQYSRRRTAITRMMAVFGVLLVLAIPQLLSARAMTAMQVCLSASRGDEVPIQIGMDPNRKRPEHVVTGGPGTIPVYIPVQVASLEQGMDLYSDDLSVEIEGPDGKVSRAVGSIVRHSDGYWQRMHLDLRVFEQIKEEHVTLRTSAYLTLLEDRETTQIEPRERATEVPGFGLCRFSRHGDNYALVCFSPLRRPSLFAKTFVGTMDSTEPYIEPGSYSPYPAETGINPLVVTVRANGGRGGTAAKPLTATIITEAPLAHCRRDFEIRGLQLRDYAIGEEPYSRTR